ncbi:UNVERIFIED_CONTAM: hypothetical protein Slati_4204500 [Sesamum latifolium]|uniref:Uncharacterized protein n=1 Tax=Sesamum latifolium TaxID=2727402 RepID=A0AAW2TDN8_9LAMI
MTDPPRRSTSSDTSTEELSPALFRVIQRIVSATIQEQLAVLTLTRTTTPSDVDVLEEVAEEGAPAHVLPIAERQGPLLVVSQEVPPSGAHAWSACRKASKTFGTKSREHPRRSSRVSLSLKKSWQTNSLSSGKSPTHRNTMEPWIHRSTSPALRISTFSTITPLGSNAVCS